MVQDISGKVSVIIPVYNAENYISECLESIICQTYKNIEIILVNDGSTDNSAKICKTYADLDERIKYIEKENGGVSSARNIGIENAQGKYDLFVDSDDWIKKETIEILVENSDDCDIVEFNVVTQLKSGNWDFKQFNSKSSILEGDMYDDLYLNVICFDEYERRHGYIGKFRCIAGKLYSKKCIGKHRFNENMKFYEDGEFFLKILNDEMKIKCLDEQLYYYRYNNGACTKSYRQNIEQESKKVYECMEKTLINIRRKEMLDYVKFEMFLLNLVCFIININGKFSCFFQWHWFCFYLFKIFNVIWDKTISIWLTTNKLLNKINILLFLCILLLTYFSICHVFNLFF